MNAGTTPGGIPPLAGICTFEDAQRASLSVEACVDWMKRHHYVLLRLHQIFTAHITAEPVYELKTAFSLHAYLCIDHAAKIRERVGELREPPLGLEVIPDSALELLCNEILCSPSHDELVLGVYDVVIPALIQSLNQYLATTNPLADAPSVRIARYCLFELNDVAEFGRKAIEGLIDEPKRNQIAPWTKLLHACIEQAGGISGQDTRPATPLSITAQYSTQGFELDPVPNRDARFQDPFNAGVNPEAFLYDERYAARDKVLMMFYKRLREIDVPEMMASILIQTPNQPWNYYRDMTRQLWDEARHAMLGEVGFVHLGIDWTQIPINFTWSRNLNTQLEPWERHAVLFFIEQGLMPRSGKRFEWEVGLASGIPLAGLIQDFDWADEVLHAQIGREWYVKKFRDLNEAMSYGDRCWSQVLSHWRSYLESGLTRHRNWWPEIYRTACERWGIEPDPVALAFDGTYETVRADLKDISASG